jgi:hypothetical protein
VAFLSDAANLIGDDTNDRIDAFVRDRQSGTTERVSVGWVGLQGNGDTLDAQISADGRYVAFSSQATNLVAGDTNGVFDVFVRDRESGTTEIVSIDSGSGQGNRVSIVSAISAGGRYVAFSSDATNLVGGDTNARTDVFVRDRQGGTTERVSVDSTGGQGNNSSYIRALSPDGRYVAFQSYSSNLVAGDANAVPDVFVHDRQTGTTARVSVGAAGAQGTESSDGGSLSADGRRVVFTTLSSNLVSEDTNGWDDVFVRDRCGVAGSATFSGDGVNADVIAPVSAQLGSSWSAPLTLGHAHGAGGVLSLKVRSTTINGPTFVSPIGGRPTEVLVAGPVLAILSGSHDGSTGDIAPQEIPAGDFSLVGVSFAAQYVVLGGGFADYSQAVAGVIGCD